MIENRKEYVFEIRTEEENKRFLELLESAKDKLDQALSEITYMNFKNINSIMEKEIKNIIDNIEKIENGVSSRYEPLYKPVREN